MAYNFRLELKMSSLIGQRTGANFKENEYHCINRCALTMTHNLNIYLLKIKRLYVQLEIH